MHIGKYLIISYLLFISVFVHAGILQYDSLRTETNDGGSFIIHKVEPKETLFSISRRYAVEINDILEANEGLEDGLKMYQELMIPYNVRPQETGSIHLVQPGETLYSISRLYDLPIEELKKTNSLPDNNIGVGDTIRIIKAQDNSLLISGSESDSLLSDSTLIHIVGPSETLYSISLQHKIDIEDIKKWNKMNSNDLKIGQRLRLVETKSDSMITEVTIPIKPLDTLYVQTDTTRFRTKTDTTGSINKTVEEGFATKIERTEDTRKYLALHRKAPIGTVIEVKNQMNGRSIFVRVVGKLPETGLNRNILIRLSHSAYYKLGALDAKTPVEIGYLIE